MVLVNRFDFVLLDYIPAEKEAHFIPRSSNGLNVLQLERSVSRSPSSVMELAAEEVLQLTKKLYLQASV